MSPVYRWICVGAVALVAADGCAGLTGGAPRPAPAARATAPAPAEPGAPTTLRGVARNAKGGAVVVTAGGPIYVLGLDAWPATLANHTVEVTGVVRRQKLIPDPVGPGGTVAQGAWGEQTVVVEATWRAVD